MIDRPRPHDRRSIPLTLVPTARRERGRAGDNRYFEAIVLAGILVFVRVPALAIIEARRCN
jgi:hypothetical protein